VYGEVSRFAEIAYVKLFFNFFSKFKFKTSIMHLIR